jgi:hypothetical protein
MIIDKKELKWYYYVNQIEKGESNMFTQFLTIKQLRKLSVGLKTRQHSCCAAKNCVLPVI